MRNKLVVHSYPAQIEMNIPQKKCNKSNGNWVKISPENGYLPQY